MYILTCVYIIIYICLIANQDKPRTSYHHSRYCTVIQQRPRTWRPMPLSHRWEIPNQMKIWRLWRHHDTRLSFSSWDATSQTQPLTVRQTWCPAIQQKPVTWCLMKSMTTQDTTCFKMLNISEMPCYFFCSTDIQWHFSKILPCFCGRIDTPLQPFSKHKSTVRKNSALSILLRSLKCLCAIWIVFKWEASTILIQKWGISSKGQAHLESTFPHPRIPGVPVYDCHDHFRMVDIVISRTAILACLNPICLL